MSGPSAALRVHLGREPVGRLWLDEQRRFRFRYDKAWLERAHTQPLSLSLPLGETVFHDEQARPFFANLLPESELRRRLARRLGLSEGNDFALLEAVGGECAGSITLLPEDGAPAAGEAEYRRLDAHALAELVAELPRRPMLAGEPGLRLSLAGAQNKLPVHFDGANVGVPLGASPSSHILKPPIQDYPDSVYNEAFCMRLAARVGLPVPAVTVLDGEPPLYLVERYDRKRLEDGALGRLHQEDFCQALGISPEQKYEKEGGPSLARSVALLRANSIQPAVDVGALLQWVVFNFLVGNADAHGKNLSLLLNAPGPRLAPFYDLMSTAVYPELEARMAMRIGGEERPDWIILKRWRAFADEIGVGFRLVRRTLETMAEHVEVEAAELAATSEAGAETIIGRIRAVIGQRRAKIQRLLADGDELG